MRLRFLPIWLLALAWFAVTSSARSQSWSSLPGIIAKARARAPTVVDASAGLSVAQSTGIGARVSSFANPYLEVVGMQQRTASAEMDAKLYLPVEIAGQRTARVGESDQLVQWRRLGVLDAQARATGEAAAAYGQVIVAAARSELARSVEQEARKEASWLTARQEADASTVVDRSLAEAEVARWVQAAAEAELQLIGAKTRLALAIGEPSVADPPRERPTLPTLVVSNEAEMVSVILRNAPIFGSLQAESGYWRAAAERARRDRVPMLSVVVSGGRGDLGEAKVGGGLAWSLPLIRTNQGEIARTIAEQKRVDVQREALRVAVEARVRGELRALRSAKEALKTIDEVGIPAADRLVEAAQASHRAGKIPLIHVVSARREAASLRARRLDLIEVAWRAYGALAALKGDMP